MAKIKMHIPKVKLLFYPPYEVKCRLQNGVSTKVSCSAFNVKAAAFPGDTTRLRSDLFICNTYLLIWNGIEGCLCR